ncbi:ISL3 family transposase [Caloramator sp. E03]|uniref:ISL3 family transposase n=1 Tax=Caloramator sp. E03 TaxID=2576307 RepID=UPI001FAA9AF4|nr:ISL3 family transposase [Caloramator sp. E03]
MFLLKNVVNKDDFIEIFVETKKKPHVCPVCGYTTSKVHDYRKQRIKDVPIQFKKTFIILRKRRLVCSECGKRFYEKLDFLPRYHRMTNRLSFFIINELSNVNSMKHVSLKANVSTHTVKRIFDTVSYTAYSLPEVISIDEFKGNSGGSKYHCILVDPVNHKVIDIIKDRRFHILSDYFRNFKNRDKVKYVVIDMWSQYADIAKTYFKNATIIIDKFHFMRYNTWAIENVRKRIQKNMDKKLRRYYKKSRKLILARKDSLDEDSKRQLEIMLLYNDELRHAHYLKESFYKISDARSASEAKILLKEWIEIARKSGIKEYISCAETLSRWFKEIVNSFDVPYTNGCVEGFNNKIKVIKRNAFGFRNFNRFRNRILHCCK